MKIQPNSTITGRIGNCEYKVDTTNQDFIFITVTHLPSGDKLSYELKSTSYDQTDFINYTIVKLINTFSVDKQEVITHLKYLIYKIENYQKIELDECDIPVLEFAVNYLEKED